MSSTFTTDFYNSRGGRGGGQGRGRGWGDRGRGRGVPPGRGRGGGIPKQDDYPELTQAKESSPLAVVNKPNNTKKVEGVGARYGFIPTAKPTVGLGRGAPIGQGAIHGLASHGVGHGGRSADAPLPSMPPGLPAWCYTPTKPASAGMPFNGILQGTPNQPPEVPVKAAPDAKFTIPSPINIRGAPSVLRGQNIGRGAGRGSRGGWFKGANSPQEEETRLNNGDEASNGKWGGGGSRGGFAAFHRRGRGTFEGSESGGRGRGQFQFHGGIRGRGGAAPWGDRACREQPPIREPVVDDLPPARDMWENIVGPALVELTAPHVAVVDKPTKLENFRCVSSYTWRKGGRTPTLIVPGSPREWLDRALPFRVPFDNGIMMFHEDAFYMANESILIPLFRAVDTMALPTKPKSATSENVDTIDWATIDFVTDRNNLRKLLRWIREPGPTLVSSPTRKMSPTSPTSDGKPGSGAGAGTEMEWDSRRDFRIDLQLGGEKAVLMQWWAARTREVIVPPKGGCRANFEREHTVAARGCEDGAGHYRIVQYDIGGLKMVVRFELDAYIIGEAETSSPPREHNARAEKVEACSDPGSNVVTRMSAESPARQSFTIKDEGASWAGGNKEPPAPQPCPHIKPEAGPKTEEGGINQAPPSEDLDWDIPDDAAAWGIASDTSQDEETEAPEMNGELTIVRAGTLLPQSAILELVTRSIRYADRTSNIDTFLQIFLTQTPTHVIAIHQNGNFEKVIRQELESAEFTSIAEMEGVQRSIAQLVELLKEIQRLVKKHGTSGRLSLVCEKGKLGLYGLAGEEGRLSDGELERFKTAV